MFVLVDWSHIILTLLPRIFDVFCCFLGSHWFHLKSAWTDRQLNPLQRTSCLILFSSKSYYVVLKSMGRFEKVCLRDASACFEKPVAKQGRIHDLC